MRRLQTGLSIVCRRCAQPSCHEASYTLWWYICNRRSVVLAQRCAAPANGGVILAADLDIPPVQALVGGDPAAPEQPGQVSWLGRVG